MKQALLIVSAMLIFFTTACAAALLVPAAVVLESVTDHEESQEAKLAENIPAPALTPYREAAPMHISGSIKPGTHISGSPLPKKHISGKSFNHVSGGSFY